MLVLGIESSCDETALALVRDGLLQDAVLASQADLHALFGGVVPELASREHYRFLALLFDELVRRTKISAREIDVVAVSRGPGLLGSLLVGVSFAKGLCLGTGARLIGVNHLMGHMFAIGLEQELVFPAIGLLISGGHTNLYFFENALQVTQVGRTIDDAVGEAFDKSGKVLGLAYPGGKLLDELAQRGKADKGLFSRPYIDNASLDFSFSGLKTAVALRSKEIFSEYAWSTPLHRVEDAPQALCDFCASLNTTIAETLKIKLERAFALHPEVKTLFLAGGVAANTLIRSSLSSFMQNRGGQILLPSTAFCTDNAAMIAYAGWIYASQGLEHSLDLETIPRGKRIPEDMHSTLSVS